MTSNRYSSEVLLQPQMADESVLVAANLRQQSNNKYRLDLLLSEMQQFKMPTDGMKAALQKMSEDARCLWHMRRAAILSIAQVAQMEHCS